MPREALRQQDVRTHLEFPQEIDAALSLGEFAGRVGENLQKLFPCEWASYNEMDLDRRASADHLSPCGVLTPAMSQRWQAVMHEHPVLIHYQQTGDLRAYCVSDFYAQRELHRRALSANSMERTASRSRSAKGFR